jgi:hypothetical protein
VLGGASIADVEKPRGVSMPKHSTVEFDAIAYAPFDEPYGGERLEREGEVAAEEPPQAG